MREIKDYSKELKAYVTDMFNESESATGSFVPVDEIDHVINIGVSILETKFPEIGPGYSGGSFVQAVVDNDLMAAMSRADFICSSNIKFFCILLYNFSPHQLKSYSAEA